MIHWAWLILAFVIGIVFATITYEAFDYDTLLLKICCVITYPFVWIAMWFITPFKNVVYPVSQQKWTEYQNNKIFIDGMNRYHLFKNIWLCHDTKAKHIQARWFFVRVKGDNKQ